MENGKVSVCSTGRNKINRMSTTPLERNCAGHYETILFFLRNKEKTRERERERERERVELVTSK